MYRTPDRPSRQWYQKRSPFRALLVQSLLANKLPQTAGYNIRNLPPLHEALPAKASPATYERIRGREMMAWAGKNVYPDGKRRHHKGAMTTPPTFHSHPSPGDSY
ncbi:hypothetical protein MTO96_032349 [Rhipicephalus appendiculatus]